MATATRESQSSVRFLANHRQDGQMAPDSSWHAREFRLSDTDDVCSWVQCEGILQLVSSDKGEHLTPRILRSWLDRAIGTVVIAGNDTDTPVGFCTLSTSEVSGTPCDFVELCHLIVAPRYRYLFIGPRICRAAKTLAAGLSFAALHGRVVPYHRYGLALARRQAFSEIEVLPSFLPRGFRWFCHNLQGVEDTSRRPHGTHKPAADC